MSQTNVKTSWFSRVRRGSSYLLMDCCRASKSIKPYEDELWPNPEDIHSSHTDRRFDRMPVQAKPVQIQPRQNPNMAAPKQPRALPARALSAGHPRLSQELPPLPLSVPPVKIRSSIEPSQVPDLRSSAMSRNNSSSSRRQSCNTAASSNPSRRSTNEDDRFKRLTKRSLGPSMIDEVLGIFDRASNMPYAVCGMTGLAAWGYTVKKPKHITIMVPPYCRDTITGWAKTVAQFETFSSHPDVIGVHTSDKKIVRINITYPDTVDGMWEDYFNTDRLQLQGIGGFADILRLSKLLNLAAVSYMEVDKIKVKKKLAWMISEDIFWILARIASGLLEGEEEVKPLNPSEIPSVMDRAFWHSFLGTYPEASHNFAAAGLEYRLQPA